MVTLVAFFTSQRIVAEKGPGPGGMCIVFGLISKTTILGGSAGGGGVVGVVGVVDAASVTVTVTDCVELPALLLTVSV
jgi:hypothetical protein